MSGRDMKRRDRDDARRVYDPGATRAGTRRLLLVAATLAAATTAVAAVGATAGEPISQLRAAVSPTFDGGCVTATEAERGIRAALHAAGYDDWTIVTSNAARSGDCVAAGVAPSAERVVLVPAERPEAVAATQRVAEDLMTRCLPRRAAVAHVASELAAAGAPDAIVRTDGPLAYPIGRGQAVRRHVADGCYVYSGSGRDPAGRPVYYLSGPGA